MARPYAIAHVTPYPWEAQENEVNTYVRGVTSELARRGHRVLILAPSRSQERVRASRRALRAAREQPQSLLESGHNGEPRVIAVGEVLDVPTGSEQADTGAADRRGAHDRGAARQRSSWTSCTCTSRSPRAPQTPRCATRAR